MSVINSIPLIAAGDDGYQISRSVRLRSSATAYFNRTLTTPTDARKWTWSAWVKIGGVPTYNPLFAAGTTGVAYGALWFNNGSLVLFAYTGATVYLLTTTAVYRDSSAWYHVQVAFDSTDATASNRVKIYINGVQVTAFSTATYPSLNYATYFNTAVAHNIGQYAPAGVGYLDGYLTDINFIDGQALTPSSFGETNTLTGVWQPKKYAGTYGTNGFYLNFSDNSGATATTIGKDYSGNGNNFTPNNISVTAGVTYDSMLDVPTPYADGGNGRGNYCVMNPLDWQTTSFPITNGNLTWTSTTTASGSSRGTMGMTTGKWYWEVLATSVGSGSCGVGIAKDGSTNFGSGQALYTSNTGNKYIDGTTTAYGATWATNNMIGIAYDADAGQITFYKDNTSQGAITLSGYAGVNVCPVVSDASSLAFTLDVNFGQRPFSYTPPTGFVALNTQNLPAPTISNGAQYMAASLFTGTGASQNVTNSGAMQPDLVWVKSRSVSASAHYLYDSIRGVTKSLTSNNTDAEYTGANTLTSFNSDGFTVSTGLIQSGQTYVGWQWKGGGIAVSNTAGTITSSVSANPTAGFSVVTYTGTGTTGATVGHGLGAVPQMIIVKNRSAAAHWPVGHVGLTSWGYNLYLSLTNAQAAVNTSFNSTTPTSTVFTLGPSGGETNFSGQTFVAYCFAEVAGYSKFGKYTGNGSADGPFVFLGFRPRWIMYKRTDTTGNWNILDTSRDPYNLADTLLRANLSNAEEVNTVYAQDFLSNGWKIRSTNVDINVSGATYIYAAFAENPFKNSLAR